MVPSPDARYLDVMKSVVYAATEAYEKFKCTSISGELEMTRNNYLLSVL